MICAVCHKGPSFAFYADELWIDLVPFNHNFVLNQLLLGSNYVSFRGVEIWGLTRYFSVKVALRICFFSWLRWIIFLINQARIVSGSLGKVIYYWAKLWLSFFSFFFYMESPYPPISTGDCLASFISITKPTTWTTASYRHNGKFNCLKFVSQYEHTCIKRV